MSLSSKIISVLDLNIFPQACGRKPVLLVFSPRPECSLKNKVRVNTSYTLWYSSIY